MAKIIAVDGPAGSGKSASSRAAAKLLSVAYLDTGSLYRAYAWAVLQAAIDPQDFLAVEAATRKTAVAVLGDNRVAVDGRDVSTDIRGQAATVAVSPVSAHPKVRQRVNGLIRAFVLEHDNAAVVEGRDIGTVVFPEADLKIWLTANEATRAQRTRADGRESLAAELRRRDNHDRNRAVAPMLPAEDAVEIDSSDIAAEEVAAIIYMLADLRPALRPRRISRDPGHLHLEFYEEVGK